MTSVPVRSPGPRGGRPAWPLLLLVLLPFVLLPFVLLPFVLLPLVLLPVVVLSSRSSSRRPPRVLPRLLVVVALLVLLAASGTAVGGEGAAPVPVVPRGAYGWPIGPDRGVTAGAAGPPARSGEDGAVTRRFRAPPTPYGRGHRGADLAGTAGEPVRAAGAGTVVFAGRVAGRGVVSVDHADGLRTTYEPVAAAVAPGAPVARGSPLGTLEPGHGACPVAACLHWGLRRGAGPGRPDGDTDYLDPLLLLGLGRVRLLPTDG